MNKNRQTIALDEPFQMRRGGVLPAVAIAYETWGELNADKSNAILILTGLSPDAHAASAPADPAAGWWEPMVGSGKPIDSDRFFVICVNSLGSCFGSTGAAAINPATGKPWQLDFPELSIEDIAATAHAALAKLGIERLHAVVGPSLGGMSALAYMLQFPGSSGHLILISTGGYSQPLTIAVHSLQREMIRSDPAWRGGYYPPAEPPIAGMRDARKLGMLSYRSAAEWKERFGRRRTKKRPAEPFGIEFEVEAYLEARSRQFIGQFDANCYLYLSRAMDLFDIREHGTAAELARKLHCPGALVIGVETDFLYPIEQQRALAELMKRAGATVRYEGFDSLQGHDSFLVDYDRFGTAVGSYLK
ncbi:MAG TPA: homoserine O-acetyltransferase [Gammaproteobacteria bacterium]|nr:homoserine O-acetyltransferase [Gammaproteobacteria bacterium]